MQVRLPTRSRKYAPRPMPIAPGTAAAPILMTTVRCWRRWRAAANARRILELGTALGYTALSFASGAPDATVDTVERDPEHVQLARDNIAAAGMDHRITVHEGDFAAVLPTLDPGYDVAFFDGGTPAPALHKTLRGLLRTGGTLITANLNHGGTADAVRKALFDGKSWRSALVDEDGETAISVKL